MMCKNLLGKIIEWKEQEHEAEDMATLHDPNTIEALRNHILLKYFKTQRIRKQVFLPEHLISMWDANDQVFHVDPHILCVEIEDVYFLIGLSKRGVRIILVGHRGTKFTTKGYID